jgi:hypothetical protein
LAPEIFLLAYLDISISVIFDDGAQGSWPHCNWTLLSTLWNRRPGICRDGDFYLGALLKAHFFAILVSERVLDAKLSIEVIGPFDGDLSLFWDARSRRLDNLFDRPRESGAWFIAPWFIAHRSFLISVP